MRLTALILPLALILALVPAAYAEDVAIEDAPMKNKSIEDAPVKDSAIGDAPAENKPIGDAPAAQNIVQEGSGWARATTGEMGAAFVTLTNPGKETIRIVSASTYLAGSVEFHETVKSYGVMQMRPLEVLEIRKKGTIKMQPGGVHLMLIGLTQPLKEGDTFVIGLKDDKGNDYSVDVTVRKE